MKLSDAFHSLKQKPDASLHYFFCEADAEGKPALVIEKRAIPLDDQKAILATAKKKAKSSGEMQIKDGELVIDPKGTPPGCLAKGVQIAARNANAMVFSGIKILKIGPVLPEIARMTPERRDELKSLAVKKYPDVLRNDARMAQVLDKKAELAGELERLLQKEDASEDDIRGLESMLNKIDKSIVGLQGELNTAGFSPRPLGAEYKDEDKKFGWRADLSADAPKAPKRKPDESDEDFAKRQSDYEDEKREWEKSPEYQQKHESDAIVTKYFSKAERAQNAVSIDADGMMVNATGQYVQSGRAHTEFVMDAKDGEMYAFTPHEVDTHKMGVNSLGIEQPQTGRIHHSTMLGGAEVASAGSVRVESGLITKITNLSGHYKPGVVHMIQCVEALMKKGALIDQQWVDANGKDLEGKAAEVYDRLIKLQDAMIEKLADDPTADVSKTLASIDTAKSALAKIGAGPSGKLSSTKVQFLDIQAGMNGKDVKEAKKDEKRKLGTKEFLNSGGGNTEQKSAKDKMRSELETKLAGKRAGLDAAATERANRFESASDPTDATMDLIAKGLQKEKKNLNEEDGADQEVEAETHGSAAVANNEVAEDVVSDAPSTAEVRTDQPAANEAGESAGSEKEGQSSATGHGEVEPVPQSERPQGYTGGEGIKPERAQGYTGGEGIKPERARGYTDGEGLKPERSQGYTDGEGLKPERAQGYTDGEGLKPERAQGYTDGEGLKPERAQEGRTPAPDGNSRPGDNESTQSENESQGSATGYEEEPDLQPERSHGYSDGADLRPETSKAKV